MGRLHIFEGENSYIIDAEDPAEMARLVDQDMLFTQVMGGPFPERADMAGIDRVLDIGCGPGGWVLDVAATYPYMQVTGIDISPVMVDYARARARAELLKNAHFQVMDSRQPLDFPDHAFDLVNARFIAGFMECQWWPKLLRECWRVLRPGGTIRLTEGEASYSNSLALQRLNALLFAALRKTGRSFSPDGNSIGMLAMFRPLLEEAGFEDIYLKPFLLDASVTSVFHTGSCSEVEASFALLKPFLIGDAQVLSEQEFETLFRLALDDLHADTFHAIGLIVTAWGTKQPGEAVGPDAEKMEEGE